MKDGQIAGAIWSNGPFRGRPRKGPARWHVPSAFLRTNPAIVTDALLVGFLANHPAQL